MEFMDSPLIYITMLPIILPIIFIALVIWFAIKIICIDRNVKELLKKWEIKRTKLLQIHIMETVFVFAYNRYNR